MPAKVSSAVFQSPQRIDVEVVTGLVQQNHVWRRFSAVWQGGPRLRSPPESEPPIFLLVLSAEREPGYVGAAVHLAVAQLQLLISAADLFPDVLIGIETVAGSGLRKQERLCRPAARCRCQAILRLSGGETGSFWPAPLAPIMPDDGTRRDIEGEILKEQVSAETLGQRLCFDHYIPQARAGRDVNLPIFTRFLKTPG